MANRLLTVREVASEFLPVFKREAKGLSAAGDISEQDAGFVLAYELQASLGRFPVDPKSADGARYLGILKRLGEATEENQKS